MRTTFDVICRLTGVLSFAMYSFWKEWTDKNNADIWGAPDESKPYVQNTPLREDTHTHTRFPYRDSDQLKKVIAKACDWIRGQGKDPEE